MNTHAQIEAQTGADIVAYVAANPVAVLTDEKTYSEFYQRVKEEVSAHQADASTDKGRKEIASLAYKVTRSKTAIDAAGKKLNEDSRAKINAVDLQRRKIREELDALAVEVRQPLTEWEEAEKTRLDYIKAMLLHIENCGNGFIDGEPYPFSVLFRELEEKVVIDETFGEFADQAHVAKRIALEKLNAALEQQQKAEADRLELEKLRAESAERDRVEAERLEAERVAAANAKQAREQAEREQREAAEQKAREERAAQAARDEEQRKAKEAIERVEREKADAIAKAEADARAIREQAEREQREREAQAKRIADEQAARDADKAHRGTVMKASKEAIMSFGADEETAKKIVLAIVAGEIPHVSLQF